MFIRLPTLCFPNERRTQIGHCLLRSWEGERLPPAPEAHGSNLIIGNFKIEYLPYTVTNTKLLQVGISLYYEAR